jgi:hypothetical protein
MNKSKPNAIALLTLFITIPILLSLTGCEKDEPEGGTTKLSGTTWKASWTEKSGLKLVETITFSGDTYKVETMQDGGSVSIKFQGTYTYNHPVITLDFDLLGITGTLTMTVEGNNTIIYQNPESGTITTYRRQN